MDSVPKYQAMLKMAFESLRNFISNSIENERACEAANNDNAELRD